MLTTLAVCNYRSIRKLEMPLTQLNVITGANGTGKSNLYKALYLLAESVSGNMIGALAKEGGLDSTLWAGPESFSKDMLAGRAPVQGGPRTEALRLKLGFNSEDYGYSISLGLPSESGSMFSLDPIIKRECIWAGPYYRPASCLVDRNGSVVRVRSSRKWQVYAQHINSFDSILNELADPQVTPEIFAVRQYIRGWRFYNQFRTDQHSPIRIPQVGTRTPVLDHEGHQLAAAIQTIYEVGDGDALRTAIDDAFPGASVRIRVGEGARFHLEFRQDGLLRPLGQAELSDGTLRYLLLIAALLTPRPPTLLVLNEPETSLHPDLLPALARLIIQASKQTQVWVVSHANRLVNTLNENENCHTVALDKQLSETVVLGQGLLDAPAWHWAD
ncbi:MAG: ATP-binding protein [Alteromonadaceae bacterium]|nr:MAG: ATP-binding protein [Alteromonadaceae bacterium]